MYTQVKLILILIEVQYLQNVVFSHGKGLNGQNDSSSASHHPIKKSPQQNFPFPSAGENPSPPSLNVIWKNLASEITVYRTFPVRHTRNSWKESKHGNLLFKNWRKLVNISSRRFAYEGEENHLIELITKLKCVNIRLGAAFKNLFYENVKSHTLLI